MGKHVYSALRKYTYVVDMNALSNRGVSLLIVLACVSSFTLEGCSSVHVRARQATHADDVQEKTVFALWWGGSDPVESVDCGGHGLNIVSVKTSWIYSLCSVVTLGAVVPMDIEYKCTEEPLQGGQPLGSTE